MEAEKPNPPRVLFGKKTDGSFFGAVWLIITAIILLTTVISICLNVSGGLCLGAALGSVVVILFGSLFVYHCVLYPWFKPHYIAYVNAHLKTCEVLPTKRASEIQPSPKHTEYDYVYSIAGSNTLADILLWSSLYHDYTQSSLVTSRKLRLGERITKLTSDDVIVYGADQSDVDGAYSSYQRQIEEQKRVSEFNKSIDG